MSVLFPTSPGVYNHGLDNENHDLIVRFKDVLNNEKRARSYLALEILGSGTFGQVLRCKCLHDGSYCALKIVKNIDAYSFQAAKEIKILKRLN